MSTVASRHEPELDIDGFLAFLGGQEDRRWELHEGYPRPMVRPALVHAYIVANLIVALRRIARPRGFATVSDVLIQADTRSGYAPDVAILPASSDPLAKSHTDPVILFEVPSPSTMDFDRAGKAKAYRALPSLQQLIFIYQDSVRVESWLRQGEAWRLRADVITARDQFLDLPPLSASVALADIYEEVAPSPLID